MQKLCVSYLYALMYKSLVSYGCYNQLPQLWLKTKPMYYLQSWRAEVQNGSYGINSVVSRAAFSVEAVGENLFL